MFSLRYTPLGYEQITGLSTAKSLTVPDGATVALITTTAQAIRWRDDGTAPTSSVGMPLAVNVPFEYTGTLAAFEAIEQTSGAVLNVAYYRVSG